MKKRKNKKSYNLNTTYDNLDYYATMDNDAVCRFLDKENFNGGIWEPCCGGGYLSSYIKNKIPNNVVSTDVYPYGEADGNGNFLSTMGIDCHIINFLEYDINNMIADNTPNIITNPPYTENRDTIFTLRAMEYCRLHNGKLALLMNTKFRHGLNRYNNIFKENPYSHVYDYVSRIKVYKNAIKTGCNMADYAWFVWDFTSGVLKTPSFVSQI